MVVEGALVNGVVLGVSQATGVKLRLPEGYHGSVCPTDVSDIWREDWTSQFSVGDVVRCRMTQITSSNRCYATLRKSW